jgi:hypothetical protein
MNTTTKAKKKPGPRVDPILSGVLAAGTIEMPQRVSNRGSKSAYPFSDLTAVGMSFGVINKTPEQLATIISNQNRKPKIGADGKPVQKKDAAGNPMFVMVDMMGADGKPNGQKVPDSNQPVYETGPQYFAAVPAPNDPGVVGTDGKKLPADKAIKARVWRSE